MCVCQSGRVDFKSSKAKCVEIALCVTHTWNNTRLLMTSIPRLCCLGHPECFIPWKTHLGHHLIPSWWARYSNCGHTIPAWGLSSHTKKYRKIGRRNDDDDDNNNKNEGRPSLFCWSLASVAAWWLLGGHRDETAAGDRASAIIRQLLICRVTSFSSSQQKRQKPTNKTWATWVGIVGFIFSIINRSYIR